MTCSHYAVLMIQEWINEMYHRYMYVCVYEGSKKWTVLRQLWNYPSVKIIAHIHLVQRLKWTELYLHHPIFQVLYVDNVVFTFFYHSNLVVLVQTHLNSVRPLYVYLLTSTVISSCHLQRKYSYKSRHRPRCITKLYFLKVCTTCVCALSLLVYFFIRIYLDLLSSQSNVPSCPLKGRVRTAQPVSRSERFLLTLEH